MSRGSRRMRLTAAVCLFCVAAPVWAGEAPRPAVLFGGHGRAGGPIDA
jgi:hypothetical protein